MVDMAKIMQTSAMKACFQIAEWEGEYTYRCILTNDYESSVREILDNAYNLWV